MEIRKLTFDVVGKSPISWSKPITSPGKDREDGWAREQRTYLERVHRYADGKVFIPANALQEALPLAGKGERIPGRGQAGYAKVLMSGIIVKDNIDLGVGVDGIPTETLFVPSDGKKGGGKRVPKIFVTLPPPWSGKATIYVMAQELTEEVIEYLLKRCGFFVGFLRWRAANGGQYGRWVPENIKMEAISEEQLFSE